MDLELPGFENGAFRFQTQCSTTEPSRYYQTFFREPAMVAEWSESASFKFKSPVKILPRD